MSTSKDLRVNLILDVPDSLPGKEKRKQLTIQMVTYACKLVRTRDKVAAFLGYSPKWVQNNINTLEELDQWRGAKKEQEEGYLEMLRKYPDFTDDIKSDRAEGGELDTKPTLQRTCLKCNCSFKSISKFNRICSLCKLEEDNGYL